MLSLVNSLFGADDLDDVRGIIMARNGDLGSRGQLNVFELLSFFANHKPVVLLGNLQVNMGLWMKRGRGRERERERERETDTEAMSEPGQPAQQQQW